MGLYIIIIYVCIYRERSITYQSILYQNLKKYANNTIFQYIIISTDTLCFWCLVYRIHSVGTGT